jgi:hypothetical protein
MDAHRALVGDATRDRIERVLAVEALAASWRGALERKLDGD